jgi:hypothetical protein
VASGRVLGRLGTPRLVVSSFALTSLALAGFALAPAPVALLLLAVPLGLGGAPWTRVSTTTSRGSTLRAT